MDAVNSSSGLATLRFLTGPLAGTMVQIVKTVTTLGREPSNDIVISDPTVSRQHARLLCENGTWIIEKLSSQNTLTVNQRQVQRETIHDRDTIGLGPGTTFLFLVVAGQAGNSGGSGGGVSLPASGGGAVKSDAGQPQAVVTPTPVPGAQPGSAPIAGPGPVPAGAVPVAGEGRTERVDSELFKAQLAGMVAAGVGTPQAPPGSQGVPSLEISSNVRREKLVYPLNKPVISIGRDPSNDIVIPEPIISAFHAQIVFDGNQPYIVHPHPARGRTLNGLLYRGQRIRGDEQFRKPLERGDIFRIGDEHGTLITLAYNDGSGQVQEMLPEIHPVPLGAPVITIGRHRDNVLVLSHPQVSGHHARLERLADGSYRIVDLGSTNHVYVNGQRVSQRLLTPGDEIRIGPFKLVYTGTELTQHDESRSIRIDALRLKRYGTHHMLLLQDISLVIPPRKFVAVVGGSGAGKSTLMDALNGLRPAQEGLVLYNGQDYYKNLAAFSTQLGYVPQDDIVHRDLTVERVLYYAAKLRLPEDFTHEQIQKRIEEVLEDVEMTHRRQLLVSKLSGGQRKRVSIAMELLANPSVFFLDEPTSGLDPGLDRKMMLLLRRLADKGHTIILVTHATTNINVCDYICFLAPGGYLAYFGPPEEAKQFFGRSDFAEIYSLLEPSDDNPNIPQQAAERFRQSADYQKYVTMPLNTGPAGRLNQPVAQTATVKPPKRGNPWRQFWLLSFRYLELLKNDVGNLLILLLQAPVIGLILFFLAGHGTFDSSSIASCQTNPPPSGLPAIPVTVPNGNRYDCQNVVNALHTPQGQALLAQKGLTEDQALNYYITPGSGGDAQKILFIMAFAAVMFGCINGAREIVKEAPIYRRERAVNLGIIPYMFSKIAVLGLLCLLQSLVLVVMVDLKAPFHQGVFLPVGLEIYITMALTSLAGLMLGLTISAIAPNNDRAMSFVPIVLIPQVIFSGIIFALNGPLMQFLGSFFAARWAMAALGSSIGLHGDKLGADDFSFHGTLFPTYSGHSQAEAVFHLLLTWFALALMSVILALLIAYFLKRKDVRR
ncbi:FHA domain-containing protein [Thermogemmatispora carboxidivorans]|uniref:FHA domain-containing protein n=1 Tax=Thermogemmatispora carboxidivorans TaxID=1382306 RepID=UPI00069B2EEC|nr:FHA domain-containing protein [Thermogemmatispora carboxidivorans]